MTTYTITDYGSNTDAYYMNSSGEIVGVVGDLQAAFLIEGSITPIPVPPPYVWNYPSYIFADGTAVITNSLDSYTYNVELYSSSGVVTPLTVSSAPPVSLAFSESGYIGGSYIASDQYYPFIAYQADIQVFFDFPGFVASINSTGDAVVNGYTTPQAFLYSDGVLISLLPPGTTSSNAADITDSGDVLLRAVATDGTSEAFIYHQGEYLNITPGDQSVGSSLELSNNGDAFVTVGTKGASSFIVYSDGTTTEYSVANGPIGSVQSNSIGQFIFSSGGKNPQGYLFSDGVVTPLIPSGMISGSAGGINEEGQVVGSAFDGTNWHAFVYQNGSYTFLDPPGAVSSYAYLIDDSGHIGGELIDSDGLVHAVSWKLDPIDTDAPVVAITNSGGLTKLSNQTISGTVDLADAGSMVFVFDGTVNVGSATVQADGTWSTDITLVGDESHTITATDTDATGNVGSSNSILFTLDRIGPTITIAQSLTKDTGSLANDRVTSDGHVKVSGTVSDLNGIASIEMFDGTNDLGSATITGSSWTFSMLLAEGKHSLSAVATDLAGNTTQTSVQPQIVVDLTKPVPSLTDVVRDAVTSLSVLTGTSEAGSTVSVYEGTKLLGSATANDAWNWSLKVNLTGNTAHTLTETATDVAGNTASSTGVTVYATSANNTLKGGSGNDFLIAGPKDVLIGAAGNDSFVFNPGFGKVTVSDFDVNRDGLLLSSKMFSASDPIAYLLSHTKDSSAGAVITVDASDTITLTNVTVAQLTAHQSDFHLF